MTIAKPTRELCVMACCFCQQPFFLMWLDELYPLPVAKGSCDVFYGDKLIGRTKPFSQHNEGTAKAFILNTCGITSRNELDTNPKAAQVFHEAVRTPFLDWKEAHE